MKHDKEMDRVCGMWVEMEHTRFTRSSNGTAYYFGSQACKEQFDRIPSGI